jgi:nucleoside-diphosphate-sugar epimerase
MKAASSKYLAFRAHFLIQAWHFMQVPVISAVFFEVYGPMGQFRRSRAADAFCTSVLGFAFKKIPAARPRPWSIIGGGRIRPLI